MPSGRIRIEIHEAEAARVLATAAGKWGEDVGRAIENAAKARCPVDEGRLRSSIAHTVTMEPGRVRVRVGSPLEYAEYVHRGTGVFGPKGTPIKPVSAKALKFPTPKQMGPLRQGQSRPTAANRGFVFAKSVKGQPPNPFLTDALTTVMGGTNITLRT